MTNEEMLLEMSNMMQVHLKPVREQLDRVEDRLTSLEKRFDGQDERINGLEGRVNGLEGRLMHLELMTENQILPILKEVRQCYVGAYERYSKGAERMEVACQDVEILKQVVSLHSKRLESLS